MRTPLYLGIIAALLSSTAYAANRPSGYTTICKEGTSCSVSATTKVAFGRADQFIYKDLNGTFNCNATTFGGRIAGGNNECSVASSSITNKTSGGTSSSTGGTSSSGSTSTSGSTTSGSTTSGSSSSSTTSTAQCAPYTPPAYTPNLNYDFRTETTKVDPTKFKVYQGCDASLIGGVKTSGRFAFIWGKKRNPAITDADIDRVLKNLNEDANYIFNTMGWPVDRLQQDGYFSNVYLYGSGLCTDSASNTEMGGWQSGINGYPMVLLSYYPVVTASERGGITHEYIHAILASMGNKAAWFNEGSNTWLQMNMEASRTGSYGVGFLDGAPFLAPHIPIENYSGWLQDGSFGGPNAEGVDLQVNGKQVSTWREYLGGYQYNSAFSHFLAVHVSKGANAWIWKKGPYNSVMQSLYSGLGAEQTQRLIAEYRARQAMVDFGPWSTAFKTPINDNWGRTISSEKVDGGILKATTHRLTPYAATTLSGTTLIPNSTTLPGWTGANQIPLKVTGKKVRVNFQPVGNNMRFQLAYRAQDGSVVYSQPVASGESCLDLTKTPKNGVVVGVASNVDYLYNGDATRKLKSDYRVHLLEGVTGTAPLYDKYYE